jgi:hypothetical protein
MAAFASHFLKDVASYSLALTTLKSMLRVLG